MSSPERFGDADSTTSIEDLSNQQDTPSDVEKPNTPDENTYENEDDDVSQYDEGTGWDDEDEDWYEDDDYYESYEREELIEENLELISIDIPKHIIERLPFLLELPSGIAVMGGVARSVAREMITGDREPMRDIDLVNILDENGESKVPAEVVDELSREYMPDDYSFGHGMESTTIEDYFGSRDFTINQVLLMDGKLLVSNVAYNDFQENIIRPTYYEMPYSDYTLGSRLFLKALMLRGVVSQVSDSVPLLEDINPPDEVGSFNIALFLNKAMSRGSETARIFVDDLADWDVIPEEYAGRPIALAKSLLEEVYAFEFRPSTDKRFYDIEECDDIGGYFVPPAMSEFYTSDPAIREAIAEYDGIPNKPSPYREGERISGHYTQEDYDGINRSSDPSY